MVVKSLYKGADVSSKFPAGSAGPGLERLSSGLVKVDSLESKWAIQGYRDHRASRHLHPAEQAALRPCGSSRRRPWANSGQKI